ncbi:putative CAS/CSE/importin domain protein [Trypanosoma vivax]|nr:putative CAS/CSE/importin domain protein [Trypanosoma vivax]
MNPIDPNDPALAHHLSVLAQNAMSVSSADREKAELEIREFQNRVDQQSGFVLLLLNMAASAGPAASFCSIVFKNTVKACWNAATAEHCITDNDKAVVRDTIADIMLAAPIHIQRNLAEAINLIAEIDFPKAWPEALTRIVDVLANGKSVAVHSAALSTAHSVLGRYRNQMELSEDIANDLRVIYTQLTAPLLSSMTLLTCEMEGGGVGAKSACVGLISAVECLRDLTTLDLGDEFIWSMEKFVHVLLKCLQFDGFGTNDASLIELKSIVMMCVAHFLQKFDEDFEKYASGFLKVVWDTISSPSSRCCSMDDIVIQGMNLISSACRGTTRGMFNNMETVENLVVQVILPNLALQESDLELYSNEHDEYIQRDIEGSDFHTRRREAGELVRSLMVTFPDITEPIFVSKLQQLLSAAGNGDWKAKELSIYLVSALSLGGQYASSQRGASQRLTNLVPFESFLKQNILSELSCNISNQSPGIIKASCIRFIATFRTHIEVQLLPSIISLLTSWLLCQDTVIHTYAGHAVERILTIQQPDQQQYVVNDAVLGDKGMPLLHNLCLRLQQDKKPNAYIMQCLMRICQNCGDSVKTFVGDIITCIGPAIRESAKNPSNPLFSYCMFEVVSRCIKLRPEDGAAIEGVLWEPMIFILQNDVLEYVPYVLQIMAQLLDIHGSTSPEPPAHYQALLEPLLLPGMYQNKGNIPAVTRLLMSFIDHFPHYVHGKGFTEKTLMVFRLLLQFKNYDHEGLNVLTSIVRAYPKETISTYMGSVYQALFQRLQTSRTPKYVRILIIFLSITVVTHGADDVVAQVNLIQNDLFWMLLQRVWLPNVPKVVGALERKVCVVALASLLGDCAVLQQNAEMWANCVLICLKMIRGAVEGDDLTSFTPKEHTLADIPQQVDDAGFTNVFCPLQCAARPPVDVCATIQQPEALFLERVQRALQGSSGNRLLELLQRNPEVMPLLQ